MRKRTVRHIVLFALIALLSAGAALSAWAATRLDTPADNYWDEINETIAVWEEVENASRYEVYLYCNNSKVATIKTKNLRYNMQKKMTKAGDYKFKVRALAGSSSWSDSRWTDYSGETYISEDYAALMASGSATDTKNSGPGASGEREDTTAYSGVVYSEQWMQDETGWWYRKADGTHLTSTWWQSSGGKWYYFDENGYMVTGWHQDGETWYYLLPDSGEMVTGEYTIDGVTWYFDEYGALIES
ncbi:MAG: hypothetical protein LUC99_10385 [Clostridiales bacterium]|nr:hypothetical protein [Clostridiales bacterium]